MTEDGDCCPLCGGWCFETERQCPGLPWVKETTPTGTQWRATYLAFDLVASEWGHWHVVHGDGRARSFANGREGSLQQAKERAHDVAEAMSRMVWRDGEWWAR
jgi:hypothetical protein